MPIYDAPLARSEPFRIGVRPLLVAGFSGLILIALSGACLIGLAAMLGRHLGSSRTLGTPNPQVLGYRP